jgi:hypothetical protein
MTTEEPTGDDPANVVLRNVAEIAQRQQQRERGAALALQIFRLLKIARIHALDNMAVLQQLDQTVEALRAFGMQSGEPLTLLFAKGTVFVAGQLLKASRAEYETALELGVMLRRLGVSELVVQSDAERSDLTALARLFQPGARVTIERGVIEPSPKVRLRQVNAARLDDSDDDLSPEDQILRTYATTVVVMRRVYENLLAGRYELPHQAKRLAQRLVMLSDGDTPAFLGITAMRNLNHDAAGRAVNRAILAVSMTRPLTNDLATLARVAMAALFYDVADPLVANVVGRGSDVVIPRVSEDAECRLPAATALVLTALGQLRPASVVRTVIAYEAQWLRQLDSIGPMYGGARRPMVAARIVAAAHRFNQLLEPDLAANENISPDDAIRTMWQEARDATERAMISLLVGALGIFPRGTPIELSTGERAIVLRTPADPAQYASPTVRVVYDAEGRPIRSRVTIDLSADHERQIVRVISEPDAVLSEVAQMVLDSRRTSLPPAPPPPSSSRSTNHVQTWVPAAKSGAPPRIASPSSGRRRVTPPLPPDLTLDPPGRLETLDSAPDDISEMAPSAPSSQWRQPAQTIPPNERDESKSAIDDRHAPSASGSLERTPFSHLLLYLLDRSLTGTLLFSEPTDRAEDVPVEHAVYFDHGVPTKIHLAARVAPLGALLVAYGLLDQAQLESAPISQPPTHEASLEAELIEFRLASAVQIAQVRNEQLTERLVYLFGLPSGTKYSFYNSLDLLQAIWGEVPGVVSPLAVIVNGLRTHPEEEAMDRVLVRVAGATLQMHPDADLADFELSEAELSVAEAIRQLAPSLPELISAGHHPDVIRRVVYALVTSRSVNPVGGPPSSSPSFENSLVRATGEPPTPDRGTTRGSNG